MTQQQAKQGPEDDSITREIERQKRDWSEPSFQRKEDPSETERLEKEKEKEKQQDS